MTLHPPFKKSKAPKQLILGATTRATAQSWRSPTDRSREFSDNIEPWVTLAQLAEKGKLHSIFFVDHLSWFDDYENSFEGAAKAGANASRIDPAAALSAMAISTKNLGFGLTLSTISEHPYHFARRLASLDQLTNGRVAWNVVASFLKSSGPNLLNGDALPEHDERYERTQEYVDAAYSLLLSSWRDDAVVYDKEKGVFADPKSIRKINHKGKYFDIPGPSITEPTKQRFPLISQAGSSPRGKLLGAEIGELVYVHDNAKTAQDIADIKKIAHDVFGRDPDSIKFILQASIFVAETHEEAEAKQDLELELLSEELFYVFFGGRSGIDLSQFGPDEPIRLKGEVSGVAETADQIKNKEGKTNNTKRELFAKQQKSRSKYIGTPSEVADIIEETARNTGVDGFNFSQTIFPSGLEDIVNLLIPELQRRGLAQTEYAVPGGTFRENFFGIKGANFVDKTHPAHKLRWEAGVSKETFEKQLNNYLELRDKRRKEALDTLK